MRTSQGIMLVGMMTCWQLGWDDWCEVLEEVLSSTQEYAIYIYCLHITFSVDVMQVYI